MGCEKIRITTYILHKGAKYSPRFLWINYQLIHIFKQPSLHDISDTLNSLPSTMESTYTRIVQTINEQVPATRALAKRTLMWIFCAGRPLTLDELVVAVAIELDTENNNNIKKYTSDAVIGACANLITVENNIVVPVHYTVQEFLTASSSFINMERRTPVQEYQIFSPDGHAELAQYCIQYQLRKWHEQESMERQLSLNDMGPFLNYAAFCFDHHLRRVPNWTTSLTDSFKDFLSNDHILQPTHRWRSTGIYPIYGNKEWEAIKPLDFCLSFGLLDQFKMIHEFDWSICGQPQYRTALHHAAQGGSISSIQTLLSMGFVVDHKDNFQKTPLYLASAYNHEEAVRLLLENGADVNAQGEDFGSALQGAAHSGHDKVVALLLESGAEINAQGRIYGSALQAAAREGSDKVVRLLLANGADVNALGGEHGTALGAAAYFGREKVAALLLEHGADVNAQGGKYGSALQAGARQGSKEVVVLLLESGATVNARGGKHGTALRAAAYFDHEEVAALLLEHGAKVDAQSTHYGTTLQAAALSGHKKMVALLLEHGANVNTQGGKYGSALQAAAWIGSEEVVILLLESGADVNAQGGMWGSALQAAAWKGNKEMLLLLLKNGADVNAQGGMYGSALHAAARENHERAVAFLWENGADVNARYGQYGTALEAAGRRGHLQVLMFLLAKGAIFINDGKLTYRADPEACHPLTGGIEEERNAVEQVGSEGSSTANR